MSCAPIHAQTPANARLYPFDDSARDPGFRSYVGRLRSAVETRSAKALRKLVDDEVVVGPSDDDKGWNRFIARWHLDDGHDSTVWEVLADLISLGFVREHPTLFVSPYLVWRFPPDLNPATHLVVTRDKAALRESASVSAPVVATLSFDIVRRLGQPPGREQLIQWVHVRTLDGQAGYVNSREVMSPLMPRAQFGKRGGRWVMTALEGPDT